MLDTSNYSAMIFQDGSVVYGRSSGKVGSTLVELCFTTASTGYQEAITDPSYYGQGIIFSSSHIGNTGINNIDFESSIPHTKAIILKNKVENYSNYLATKSLEEWLKTNNVLLLHDIDTRALIDKITKSGAQNSLLITSESPIIIKQSDLTDYIKKISNYHVKFEDAMNDILNIDSRNKEIKKIVCDSKKNKKKVVVIDFGVKLNILRLLAKYNFNLTVIPCTTDASQINFDNFDAIVLSNGPADPKDAIKLNKKLINLVMSAAKPIFGICLGHQILAISHPNLQLTVEKMHQGHRGINHPIQDLKSEKIAITSQNHGFNAYIAKCDSEKAHNIINNKSLFDQTIAGFLIKNKKILSTQYHPESSPGTHDSEYLFQLFYEMIDCQDSSDERDLNQLEEKLNYYFNSKDLLLRSLRHPSMHTKHSYEKLEFIGDKVLNLTLAEALLSKFPKDDEGQLSLKLNKLVSGEIIVQVALEIELGKFIEMSESEEQSKGQQKKNNLEDCMEAIIGGIFLDSNFENTKSIILKLWGNFIDSANKIQKDPKSKLQEWLQKRQFQLPEYLLINKDGPSHDPIFTIRLVAQEIPQFEATASSLKEAQTKVAKIAIEYINKNK